MTSTKLDIKINQSIISILGRKLYQSNFGSVVLRELLQNSLDAGANEIRVNYDESCKILIVQDNGRGIEKIDGLLNVIGESIKSEDIETIGGYGLAKLAIFGCKEWEFISIGGSFSTGFLVNPEKCIDNGTIVTCMFGDNDVSWNYGTQIKGTLQTISRKNVIFFYNNEKLNEVTYNTLQVGNREEKTANTNQTGYIIVRVNGLMTFREYISGLTTTVYMDYAVTCDPYDDNYPLTSNRDGFIESSTEYNDYKMRVDAIRKKIETDKKLAENIAKKDTITKWRGKEYISGGNISKSDYDNNAMEISSYERYIKQIADIRGYDVSDCKFGLSDGTQENGMYSPDLKAFYIAKNIQDKGEILTIAIHEFVHYMGYGLMGHDQQFAYHQTRLTGDVLSAIFDGKFRK